MSRNARLLCWDRCVTSPKKAGKETTCPLAWQNLFCPTTTLDQFGLHQIFTWETGRASFLPMTSMQTSCHWYLYWCNLRQTPCEFRIVLAIWRKNLHQPKRFSVLIRFPETILLQRAACNDNPTLQRRLLSVVNRKCQTFDMAMFKICMICYLSLCKKIWFIVDLHLA